MSHSPPASKSPLHRVFERLGFGDPVARVEAADAHRSGEWDPRDWQRTARSLRSTTANGARPAPHVEDE